MSSLFWPILGSSQGHVTWYLPRTNVPEIEMVRASSSPPDILGIFHDFFLWCQLDSPFWILVGMSIRPSQPQREENPFSGFLLHLAPCLASSRSSILGVWGHQPNKPLWIQKVCQCRQERASRGLQGGRQWAPGVTQAAVLALIRFGPLRPASSLTSVPRMNHVLKSQGLLPAWPPNTWEEDGQSVSFWFLPVSVHMPGFSLRVPT